MEEYTLDHPDVEILDPNIIVFHNAVKDPDALIDYYEEYGEWRGWYGFGRQIDSRGQAFQAHPHQPTWDDWLELLRINSQDREPDQYLEEIAKVFHLGTKFYTDYTGRTLPNWSSQAWGLARYIPDEDLIDNAELTMNYHTDYMPDDQESPGDKFAITAVIYPNDDYEGGEISFRVRSDDGTFTEFDYKPRAGDIVMFPSGHPYYHGVKRISGAPKYIIRLYWMYHFDGTEDWHELKAKYGDKFEELEHQRRKRHDLMIMAPTMRYRFTLKEYYELLESGQLLEWYNSMEGNE